MANVFPNYKKVKHIYLDRSPLSSYVKIDLKKQKEQVTIIQSVPCKQKSLKFINNYIEQTNNKHYTQSFSQVYSHFLDQQIQLANKQQFKATKLPIIKQKIICSSENFYPKQLSSTELADNGQQLPKVSQTPREHSRNNNKLELIQGPKSKTVQSSFQANPLFLIPISRYKEKNKKHFEQKVLRNKALKKVKEMKPIDLSTITSVESSRQESKPTTPSNNKDFYFRGKYISKK